MVTRAKYASALVLATATLALNCNQYLFEQKCPQQLKESQIVVPAAKPTPADILFIVDNSGSMADEQENLANNFEAFITQIAGAGDYQIMVVTTDVDSGEMNCPRCEAEGLLLSNFATQEPFNLIDFNSTGCRRINIEHGCSRGPEAAKRIISSKTMTRAEQISVFQDNVRVGSCGSGNEAGLNAMKLALEAARGGCNAGFLRPEANLVVVIVSDEQDFDPADPDTPVEQYVNDLSSITMKGFANIRVAAVVGSVDGVGSNCRIPNNGSCGSLCNNRPPEGSHTACMTNSPACPAGEFCQPMGGNMMGQCQNEALRYWSPEACLWCSFYNREDCCSALNGSRYVDFARAVEARVSQADARIQQANCRGAPGQRIACLIDSICQESFSSTLERIARDLVISTDYNLDPPPIYPQGVVVKLKNGRFPPEGTQLEYGREFQISADGRVLSITAGDKTPVEGEDVEIYYVTDKESGSTPIGACGINP